MSRPTWTTTPRRSRLMRRVRPRGARSTEARLAGAFARARIRGFRRNDRTLPGTPDFSFTAARLVVFVDGCFWHGCPDHGSRPVANGDLWRAKLDANAARDRRVERELLRLGWTVLRVWEHELVGGAATVVRVVARCLAS